MRFAHMGDVHIGSWRDPKLKEVSLSAFSKAVDSSIMQKVDFVLISGDLFNTAIPQIDLVKGVVTKLRELKRRSIPVYLIPGSHDYSYSGKTMLDVLEEAGLFVNVVRGGVNDGRLQLKFTIDQKTGAKITGILGKKGMLDKSFYENLDKSNIEAESGYKIFMFHTALTEFKPKDYAEMDSSPLSLLPKGFNYYAGGHVHYIFSKQEDSYGWITYPGALFPCNFKELEDFGCGGYYLVDVIGGQTSFEYVPVKVIPHVGLHYDCTNKMPKQVEEEIVGVFAERDVTNAIITLRVAGRLQSGSVSDVDFKSIFDQLYEKGAYFIMKNTVKLSAEEFDEIKVEQGSVEDVEESLIKEHVGQISVDSMDVEKESEMTAKLMSLLAQQKTDGETKIDFENRMISEIDGLFK